MECLYERLNRLMKNAGLTPKSMAFLLGVSEQKAENLLTGYSSASLDTLLRIAQIFDVTLGYAAAISDEEKCSEPDEVKEVYVVKDLYKGMITSDNVVGTIYMNRDDMHGKDYFAFVASDDSMVKARIYRDDILIIRKQSVASNNDVVLAELDDGRIVVRRYNRVGNIVTLTAEGDRIKYDTVKIDVSEKKLSIMGKICEIRVRKI